MSILTGSPIESSQELRDTYFADFPSPGVRQAVRPREEMIAFFLRQRRRVVEALTKQDTSTWDGPAPAGLPHIFPTRGVVWGILGTHQYWHIGQLMTIRTMTGKPAFSV